MTDLDALARAEVDAMLPLPAGITPDWRDVLERAGRGRRRWSRAGIAVAAAVAAAGVLFVASPLGAALVRALDDFSAWVRGEPGRPASPAEQEEFQQANERSWAGFAADAKLRRLIQTELSGTSFTLFGFRSGDLLCLRLVAAGDVSARSTHCAPVSVLQRTKAPAVVVAADEPLGGSTARPADASGYASDSYTATFGIASDGVRAVVLNADDGRHEAIVAGNAFLYLSDHPKVGTRVRSVEAVAGNGARAPLAFESSPFGMLDLPAPPRGSARGPRRVDRRVVGGSIGWLARREARGEPPSPALHEQIERMSTHMLGGAQPVLERVLRPDPGDAVRIGILATAGKRSGVVDGVCYLLIGPGWIGGSCERVAKMFARGPFTVGLGGSGPSQYSLLSGLASDDVAALKVFLASGATLDVPLRDNAYLARVGRAEFPIRLVGYDRDGRVIGLATFASDGMTSTAPARARATVRRITAVVGDRGGRATLRAGEPVGGYRCWTIFFDDGHGGGGCTPWPSKERPLLYLHFDFSAGDAFLVGQVPPAVASVGVTFTDGTTETLRPASGFILSPIPSSHVTSGRVFVELRAYDANGKEVDRSGLRAAGHVEGR